MIKRLTRQGNSRALVIDKPVMELLKISADSQIEIRTDGRSLLLTPLVPQTAERRRAFLRAMKDVERVAGPMLKRLARR